MTHRILVSDERAPHTTRPTELVGWRSFEYITSIMYRCSRKECRHAQRIDVLTQEREYRGLYNDGRGYRKRDIMYTWPDGIKAAGWIPRRACPACADPRTIGDQYLSSLGSMTGKVIEGTLSETVGCDARCMGAVGHICNCSCAGRNHGRYPAPRVRDVTPAHQPALLA